jgi:hypothetical protein
MPLGLGNGIYWWNIPIFKSTLNMGTDESGLFPILARAFYASYHALDACLSNLEAGWSWLSRWVFRVADHYLILKGQITDPGAFQRLLAKIDR